MCLKQQSSCADIEVMENSWFFVPQDHFSYTRHVFPPIDIMSYFLGNIVVKYQN